MRAFHLRVGWIARERLAELLGDDPTILALAARTRARPPVGEGRGGHRDLEIVRAFVRHPRIDGAPRRRTLAGAATAARDDDERAMVEWAESVTAMIRAAESAEPAPYAAITRFLAGLGDTDFPLRLTFSQPELAGELFDGDGRLADSYRRPGRRTTRAFLTVIAYALGAVGRMSPRDAWITAAFGEIDDEDPGDAPLRLERDGDRVIADPDLAWFDRRWTDLPALAVAAGEGAWDHLRRRAAAIDDVDARGRRGATLDALAPLRARLADAPLTLSGARAFLRDADAILRRSVDEAVWSGDPHRFWITRVRPTTLRVGASALGELFNLYPRRRAALAAAGHLAEGPPPRPRLPYPILAARVRPGAVHLAAAEYFDWIVEPGAPGLHCPESIPQGCAPIVSVDEEGARLDGVDPNPRRSAERFAAALAERPRFADDPADRGFVGLRPPPIADNRVVRLAGPEVDVDAVEPGAPALYYSSLISPASAAHLGLEVASSRYDDAPDLAPRWFRAGSSVALTIGRVCPEGQVWLLTGDDLAALRGRIRRAEQLALLYHLEVHEHLGRPTWAQILVDGQRSALYTASLLSWFYLLHALRGTREVAAVLAPCAEPAPPRFIDELGRGLPAQVVLR